MLARNWRKRCTHTLLVGMQTGTITMENSITETPQKSENWSTKWPSTSTPGNLLKENEISIQKRTTSQLARTTHAINPIIFLFKIILGTQCLMRSIQNLPQNFLSLKRNMLSNSCTQGVFPVVRGLLFSQSGFIVFSLWVFHLLVCFPMDSFRL